MFDDICGLASCAMHAKANIELENTNITFKTNNQRVVNIYIYQATNY